MNNQDNFIMLPTNDFCFKELMQNPKVRKGFIAGVLGKIQKKFEKLYCFRLRPDGIMQRRNSQFWM